MRFSVFSSVVLKLFLFFLKFSGAGGGFFARWVRAGSSRTNYSGGRQQNNGSSPASATAVSLPATSLSLTSSPASIAGNLSGGSRPLALSSAPGTGTNATLSSSPASRGVGSYLSCPTTSGQSVMSANKEKIKGQ